MKVIGPLVLVLALAVAVIPALNNCAHDGKALTLNNGRQVPMKCLWSAQAELAMAGSLGVLGVVMATSRRKETQRSLAVLGVTLGAFVTLIPTALIGVCTDMTASCNLVMRPAMLFVGALLIAASLGALVVSERQAELAA